MVAMDAEFRKLIDVVKDAIDIDGRVERSPYLMMAGALGAGFVLGGGVFTRLTERLAMAGLRVGLTAALPRVLDDIIEYLKRTAEGADSQNEEGEST